MVGIPLKVCTKHGTKTPMGADCYLCEQDAAAARAENILRRTRHGVPPVEGAKHDNGKPRWSLLPLAAVKEVIGVLEFGAKKYDVDNWQKVPDARTRYYDAAMRHLTAWREGESLDPESGLHHLVHAGCCVLFLLWFEVKS